ncbi:sigma-70 family RNA polymerase sigma factor [Dactylosporangium sp. CA-092794]|uniref:sigma-70 family RNA polymerase sigma factor n=1 Tax=Dactylosporangium sp. CA-092794 TaxID=3239929 RepID=UPI003D8ED604
MEPSRELVEWFERVLVPESSPALRQYIGRLLPGDPHRVEDIVQETLLRAWRHLATVAAARSPQAWLTRVARNLAIDWVRRHAARPTEVDEVDEDSAPAIWTPGEGLLDAALDRVILVGALRDLSPVHREVLIRVHFRDRTHAEVAGELGVPLGTVKSRAYYAAQLLRRALGHYGVTDAFI